MSPSELAIKSAIGGLASTELLGFLSGYRTNDRGADRFEVVARGRLAVALGDLVDERVERREFRGLGSDAKAFVTILVCWTGPGASAVYAGGMRTAVIAAVAVVAACGGGHHHGPAAHPGDTRHLYVEVFADGSHRRALRDGARRGLARVGFVVASDRGGDVEVQIETAKLATAGNSTTCSVKILVFRLPQHDLLGIADGSARAAGDSGDAADECVRQLGETLVAGKVRTLFVRQLGAKR